MKKSSSFTIQRILLSALCVVLAVVLVALVAGVVYFETLMGRMNKIDPDETLNQSVLESVLNETDPVEEGDETLTTLAPEDVTFDTTPAETIGDGENLINIILVGQDRREGQGRQRSDAMILCTINKEKKTLTMTSFLRDTWVMIPGYYNERLNVPYMLGGFKLLNKTLEHHFGVQVDHGIEVDFSGFASVIDYAGGVEIELTKAEAQHMNSHNGDWKLKEGKNLLNGEQALDYSRIRYVSGTEGSGDFGRTNRQRVVLMALLEKVKTMNLAQMNEFVNGVLPMISTDMTTSDITGYVVELFPLLSELEVNTLRIPADGTYQYARIQGKSVLSINMKKNRELLKEAIGE